MTHKLLALSAACLLFSGCVSHVKNDAATATTTAVSKANVASQFYLTDKENSDVLSHQPVKVKTPVTTQTVAHDVL